MYCISDRSDVCEDCECEWDADDGEEEAEDAAASRARRDVTVTWEGRGCVIHNIWDGICSAVY